MVVVFGLWVTVNANDSWSNQNLSARCLCPFVMAG